MSDDISKFTKKEIAEMSKNLTKIANAKLKEMRNLGYDKYNYSMIRKYNALTTYDTSTKTNITKKGYFRSGGYSKFTKAQLIHRYEVMNEFVNNPFATVAYTQRHLEELRDRWSLSDDEIKEMFSAYREFGYDNFTDSDGILRSFSKIMNDAPQDENGNKNPSEHLRNVLAEISRDLDNKGKSELDYVNKVKEQAKFLPS